MLPALTTGNGFTVTITLSLLMQPLASVPIKIYLVVTVGVATGDAEVVEERPLAGLHTYEFAPLAVKVVDAPAQIATSAPALTVGNG